MAISPEELSRAVREYFICVPGDNPGEITIAFRGDTETGNAGTSGVRTVSFEEVEMIGQSLLWLAQETRQYIVDHGIVRGV